MGRLVGLKCFLSMPNVLRKAKGMNFWLSSGSGQTGLLSSCVCEHGSEETFHEINSRTYLAWSKAQWLNTIQMHAITISAKCFAPNTAWASFSLPTLSFHVKIPDVPQWVLGSLFTCRMARFSKHSKGQDHPRAWRFGGFTPEMARMSR